MTRRRKVEVGQVEPYIVDGEGKVVLYIAEGKQMGYLSGDVTNMLGW